VRELSAAEIADFIKIHRFCCCGNSEERVAAQEYLRVWLLSRDERDVDLADIANLLAVPVEAVQEWLLGDVLDALPLRSQSAINEGLVGQFPDDSEESVDIFEEPIEVCSRSYLRRQVLVEGLSVQTSPYPSHVRSGGVRTKLLQRATILVLTGSDKNGNRFGAEMNVLRRLAALGRKKIVERNCVSADDLEYQLRSNPAAIVHIGFHSEFGAAEFEAPDSRLPPVQLRFEDMARLIAGVAPPGFIHLAGCDSVRIADSLKGWADVVVAWPDVVSDREILDYSSGLYVSLFRGECADEAHRAGCVNIRSVVGQDRMPVFKGSGSWRLSYGIEM
jgi:hypothetical protein